MAQEPGVVLVSARDERECRLSQALLAAPAGADCERAVAAGLESLEWLTTVQQPVPRGHFVPIGSDGFYPRAGARARFDQQPIEAGAMVSACLQALRVTGDPLGIAGVAQEPHNPQ